MTGPGLVLVALVGAVVLAACGSGVEVTASASSVPTTTPAPTTSSTVPAPVEPPPEVVLLSGLRGSDGHLLRLHPAVGDVQHLTNTLRTTMEVAAGFRIERLSMEVEIDQTVEVTHVYGDQAIIYETTIDRYELVSSEGLPPGTEAQMDDLSDTYTGLTSTVQVDSRGQVHEAQIDPIVVESAPEELRPMMQQMVRQLGSTSLVFPEERVAVGATWRVESPIELIGVDLGQVANYRLVAADDDAYELVVSFDESSSRPGVIEMPGVPAGAAAVDHYAVDGEMTVNGAFTHVLPSRTSGTLSSDASFVIHDPSGDVSLDQSQDLRSASRSR